MKTENNYEFEPEKLSLWDRFFNRYRKVVIEEGRENWTHFRHGVSLKTYNIPYQREYVKYAIVDRLTGGVTIKKDYLN